MNNYVIFRRNAWLDGADLERAASRAVRAANEDMAGRVRWIRSYVCQEDDGTLGSVCIYQAHDRDALFTHARCANLVCNAVLPLARSIVLDEPSP